MKFIEIRDIEGRQSSFALHVCSLAIHLNVSHHEIDIDCNQDGVRVVGVLPHGTTFAKKELVRFAEEMLKALK